MNLILIKMFATALALAQVTTRPESLKIEFDAVNDQAEVVQLLKSSPAVLVRDAEKYQGIVTRFDVVGHIGGQS